MSRVQDVPHEVEGCPGCEKEDYTSDGRPDPVRPVPPPPVSSYTGALVALTVDAHCGASGTGVGESSFMPLRDQRERRGSVISVVGADEGRGELSATRLHPHWVCADPGARFAIGQRVPRCQWRYWP